MYKPGLEEFLADLNLGYFFTDTHVIVGGQLVGKVAGDVIGPYGALPKRKLVVRADKRPEAKQRTIFSTASSIARMTILDCNIGASQEHR